MEQYSTDYQLFLILIQIITNHQKDADMLKLFTQHPNTVNENYFQHMLSALSFFTFFCYAAFAAFVHAFLPFLFVKTGSKIIAELNNRMITSRHRKTKNPSST